MNIIEIENEEERKIKEIKCEHRFTLRTPGGLEYCYICHELIGATLEAQEQAKREEQLA